MPHNVPSVVIEEVAGEALAMDQGWWATYETSFPSSEKEPRDAILRTLDSGIGMAFRARQRHRTVGLSFAHLLQEPRAVFLVYLAVSSDCRGRGLGARLLEYAWERGTTRLGPGALGMVWEVDMADLGQTPDDVLARKRRRDFFMRQGGEVLAAQYRQPPVDGKTIVPMHLFFRPVAGVDAAIDVAPDRLVRAIYFEKYGAVNGIPGEVLTALLEGDERAS